MRDLLFAAAAVAWMGALCWTLSRPRVQRWMKRHVADDRAYARVYAEHARNHVKPEPECWYCQNEREEARTDNQV